MFSGQTIFLAMAIAFTAGAALALLYIFAPERKRKRRKPSVTPFYANLVWGVIGLLIASFAVGVFGGALARYNESRSWPVIKATVTYFLHVPAENDDDSSQLSVKVSYEYGGRQYRDIELPSSDSGMYEGQRLAVRVNPGDPGQLYRDSRGVWVMCAVLFAFGFALCALGVAGLRRQRLQTKAPRAAPLTKAERWGNDTRTGQPVNPKKMLLFLLGMAALIALYIVSLKNNELAANIFIGVVLGIVLVFTLLRQLVIFGALITAAGRLFARGKTAFERRRAGENWKEILNSLQAQPEDTHMHWPNLYGPGNQPTARELQAHVACPLWDELADHLAQTYRVQPALVYGNDFGEDSFYHGWRVNYKKGGKTLCTLYPKPGFFVARIHIGRKETQGAEQLLRGCDVYTKKLYRDTPQKDNGKALCLEVTTEAILRDAKALVALRAGFGPEYAK